MAEVVSVSLDAKKRRRSRDVGKSARSFPENAALRELARARSEAERAEARAARAASAAAAWEAALPRSSFGTPKVRKQERTPTDRARSARSPAGGGCPGRVWWEALENHFQGD